MSFYIQAHQDDWQGHMGSHATEDLLGNGPVVFVFTTNGDGGYKSDDSGTKNYADHEAYSKVRNKGARKSVSQIVTRGQSEDSDWAVNQDHIVNNHRLERWSLGNKICIFMNLDDGKLDKLLKGELVRASTGETYTWNDFCLTLAKIIADETTANGEAHDFWIHYIKPYIQPDDDKNYSGHDDHHSTGLAVREAVAKIKQTQLLNNKTVNMRGFRGSFDAECVNGEFKFKIKNGELTTKDPDKLRFAAFYAYEVTMLNYDPAGKRCTLRERPVQIAKWIDENVILETLSVVIP